MMNEFKFYYIQSEDGKILSGKHVAPELSSIDKYTRVDRKDLNSIPKRGAPRPYTSQCRFLIYLPFKNMGQS